jgi:hypothetical protein
MAILGSACRVTSATHGAVRPQAQTLLRDDFATGAAGQGEFNELFHAGGTEQNIERVDNPAGHTGGALQWTRKTAGYYYARPTRAVSSGTGRVAISYQVNFETTNPYWWKFSLLDPTLKTVYLQLFSGLGYEGNVIYGAYGKLMYVNPDSSWRTLCAIKPGWRELKLIVDFNVGTATIYYDNMQIPVADAAPLLSSPNLSFDPFKPMFDGFSSQGEGGFSISNFLIADLPAEKRATARRDNREATESLRLTKADISLEVSASTGGVAGLTYAGKRLLTSGNDSYALENRGGSAYAREQDDHVQASQPEESRLTLTCTNPELPGITIHKTYSIDASGDVGKRVEFSSSGPEGFLTYRLALAFDRGFAGSASPLGFSYLDGLKPGETTFLRDTPCLISRDYRFGVGLYRFRVNDRYVLPDVETAGGTQGWECQVFQDYLAAGKTVSAEMRAMVFSGDAQDYEKRLTGSAEYAAMFRHDPPEWVSTLVSDAMFTATGILPYIKTAAPLTVSSSIWFLNPPWGNWWSTSNPPNSPGSHVADIAPGFRTNAPNARVSAYANELFDRNSDVFKMHPDFGVTDKEGNPTDSGVPSDSAKAPTYYLQIRNPAARDYYTAMYLDRVKNWKLDFLYLDEPGALHETPDWKLKTVVQSYDWIDFYRDLKAKLLQQTPDAALWTNGFMPYSDLGYLEWLDQPWQEIVGGESWRYYAFNLWLNKVRQPEGYLIVPTYGRPAAQPGISTYSIAYGWGGHGSDANYLPWQTAALEFRGARIARSATGLPWWRTGDSTESFGVTKGDNAMVQIISHSDADRARITIHPQELGLEAGHSYLLRILTMNAPEEKAGLKAFTSAEMRTLRTTELPLTLTVPIHKGLLTTVIFSKALAIAESNGSRASETGLTDTYACLLKPLRVDGNRSEYDLTCKIPNLTLFLPYASHVESPGKSVSSETATVNGVQGVRVRVAVPGTFRLNVESNP